MDVLVAMGSSVAFAYSVVVAVALTERSMMASGDLAWSTTAAAAAMVVPGLWFATLGSRRTGWGLLVAGVAVVGACLWLWARFMDPASFESVEVLRIALTYGLAVGVVVVVLGGAIREAYGGYDTRRLADVAILAMVVAILAAAILVGAPLELLVIIVVLPLLGYPLLRGGTHRLLERLILGEMRQRAAVEAIERERERLAREIHDEPLQRLAAVARSLDTREGLAEEASILRSVSAQLRDVAVELHPPVLADLGLAAALAEIVDRLVHESGASITAAIEPSMGDGLPPRAPDDVELAVCRIAQEALGNAVRHSGARRIDLQARVRPDAIELVISDDGVGIDRVAMGQATQRGHVGLRSMAERAELIGASLRIEPARPGTRVVLTWPS